MDSVRRVWQRKTKIVTLHANTMKIVTSHTFWQMGHKTLFTCKYYRNHPLPTLHDHQIKIINLHANTKEIVTFVKNCHMQILRNCHFTHTLWPNQTKNVL